MNEETKKTYPEQQNPPSPTYQAVIRGIPIGGWLYYADNANQITIIVTIKDTRVTAEEFAFAGEGEALAESRAEARLKAKNLWRQVVLAVLSGV